MVLAYVFWHWPAEGVDRPAYEDALRGFHTALAQPGSWASRLARAPWPGQRPEPYEDWYPVDGWEQIGTLDHRAVSGVIKGPHDAVAAQAGPGAGAVYARLRAGAAEVTFAAWLSKPAGTSYDVFIEALLAAASGASVWQRQLVLGPAPEFAVLAGEPLVLPWPSVLTGPRPILG